MAYRINSTIYFDSYSAEQMVEIVHIQAKNQGFILNRRVDPDLLDYFKERTKDRNFGNGREAKSLLENAMVFAAGRVKKFRWAKLRSVNYKRLQYLILEKRWKECGRVTRCKREEAIREKWVLHKISKGEMNYEG